MAGPPVVALGVVAAVKKTDETLPFEPPLQFGGIMVPVLPTVENEVESEQEISVPFRTVFCKG